MTNEVDKTNLDPALPLATKTASRAELGVRFEGTAKTGHTIAVSRNGAVADVFNASDNDQASAFLSHCLKVLNPDEAGDGGPSNDERHFMLSIIRDLAPRDPVESMLAVQMAATHVATIRAGRRMANCDNLPQVRTHYTGFAKLTRAFAAQVEALRKHRNGGKQTVIVQHVNVADGGQAIVGTVQAQSGG